MLPAMHEHARVITEFYSAFQRKDGDDLLEVVQAALRVPWLFGDRSGGLLHVDVLVVFSATLQV